MLMQPLKTLSSLVVFICILITNGYSQTSVKGYEKEWKKVEAFAKKNLPKSAFTEVKKIYAVTLDKPLTKEHFESILKGVHLEDGVVNVDVLAYTDNADKTQIGVEIHSGRNRIVRRIFEHFHYDVRNLDRVMFAGLTKKNVNRGKWRFLTEKEVRDLKYFKKGK